jgi:hypothetical protein
VESRFFVAASVNECRDESENRRLMLHAFAGWFDRDAIAQATAAGGIAGASRDASSWPLGDSQRFPLPEPRDNRPRWFGGADTVRLVCQSEHRRHAKEAEDQR